MKFEGWNCFTASTSKSVTCHNIIFIKCLELPVQPQSFLPVSSNRYNFFVLSFLCFFMKSDQKSNWENRVLEGITAHFFGAPIQKKNSTELNLLRGSRTFLDKNLHKNLELSQGIFKKKISSRATFPNTKDHFISMSKPLNTANLIQLLWKVIKPARYQNYLEFYYSIRFQKPFSYPIIFINYVKKYFSGVF